MLGTFSLRYCCYLISLNPTQFISKVSKWMFFILFRTRTHTKATSDEWKRQKEERRIKSNQKQPLTWNVLMFLNIIIILNYSLDGLCSMVVSHLICDIPLSLQVILLFLAGKRSRALSFCIIYSDISSDLFGQLHHLII